MPLKFWITSICHRLTFILPTRHSVGILFGFDRMGALTCGPVQENWQVCPLVDWHVGRRAQPWLQQHLVRVPRRRAFRGRVRRPSASSGPRRENHLRRIRAGASPPMRRSKRRSAAANAKAVPRVVGLVDEDDQFSFFNDQFVDDDDGVRGARAPSVEKEPAGGYYDVALVSNDEVVLLLGDCKKDAYKRTKARPSLEDPVLVCRRESVFGRRSFAAKARLDGRRSKEHEIVIEYALATAGSSKDPESEMWITEDGFVLLHVKSLQWKFRGNETVLVDQAPVQVIWDVHDWLFAGPGTQAVFVFKPGAPPEIQGDIGLAEVMAFRVKGLTSVSSFRHGGRNEAVKFEGQMPCFDVCN